jgi:hypothetical protein
MRLSAAAELFFARLRLRLRPRPNIFINNSAPITNNFTLVSIVQMAFK